MEKTYQVDLEKNIATVEKTETPQPIVSTIELSVDLVSQRIAECEQALLNLESVYNKNVQDVIDEKAGYEADLSALKKAGLVSSVEKNEKEEVRDIREGLEDRKK